MNPSLPLPPISETELDKGLLNLINRKLVPSFIDLSPLVNTNEENTPLVAQPAVLNPFHTQLIKKQVQTSEEQKPVLFKMQNSSRSLHDQACIQEPRGSRKKEAPTIIPFGNQKIINVKSDNASIYLPKNAIQQPLNSTLDPTEDQKLNALFEANHEKKKQQYLRTYLDLMDEYSLHHVIVRHGTLLNNTPEYLSFYRTYQYNWPKIYGILMLLERLLKDFSVPLAYVDGKKVVFLAEKTVDPTNQQLIDCLVNSETVIPYIHLPDVKFLGRNGPNLAATAIQRVWRGYSQRNKFKELKRQHHMASIIQRWWFLRTRLFRTKERIQKLLYDEEFKWKSKMEEFKKNWDTIKKAKRTIVHINSLSYDESVRKTFPKFKSHQNSQLFRLLDLLDPNVDIIFIASYHIDSDALSYVVKLLEYYGVEEPMKRVKFVTPENSDKFQENLSLSTLVYYSQRTLKHIKTLVMGKVAFIVPGHIGKDDLRLAIKLQLPILGPDPLNSTIYGTKSGSKRIFSQADVNTPIGIYDIYEEEDLISNLTKKILEYPNFNRWLIKIDTEMSGRGLAYLETSSVHAVKEKRKNEPLFTDRVRTKILEELSEYMPERINLVSKYVYPKWMDFITSLKNSGGGVIEAVPNKIIGSPTVNLYIEPNGEIQILSVQEQLLSPQYCAQGCAFPQYSAPYEALREASLSVGHVCYSKKIMGYLSIDYVIFLDEKESARMWAVDLKLRLTDNSLMHRVFELVTNSQFDMNRGIMVRKDHDSTNGLTEVKRSYIYSGIMRNPSISTWHHSSFFNDCRMNGHSLDCVGQFGVVFQQVDSLLRGQLGELCIGKNSEEAISFFTSLVEFISNMTNDEDHGLPFGYESNLCNVEALSRWLSSASPSTRNSSSSNSSRTCDLSSSNIN
ncbi:hypothetical protein FDP41_007648 [Naegleria fowleri]|uniref:IQCH-like ATP-grasp domain-containing protein n=1 Tax=Naegleria fowleri TaxID=5763 RepID=A0A6A5BZZ6_NAEFO|nr:uncharacterized protein FDP41_007648 [Naegleria fowleri]KAF0983733.1 hypothetical protein FDP41_007648 [Naegleria fowleri]